MLVNNSTRIGRLPLDTGTLNNHQHQHHYIRQRHVSTHLTTTVASSFSTLPTSSSSTSTTTTNNDPSSLILKKRHHRSCQSSCHSSSSSSTTTTSSSLSSSSSSSLRLSSNNYGLELGQKVTVSNITTLGTIRFIGTTSFKPGIWVGIELDTIGTGKNSGTVNGVRYFDCPPETGLFILAKRVTPLEQSTFATSTATRPAITNSPQKSLTTTTQRRRTKTPSMDTSSPSYRTLLLHPRQRCSSHNHHQPPTTTTVLTTLPKRKQPMSSSSSKASRPQSRTDNSTTNIGHKESSTPPFSLTCHKVPLSTTRKSATPLISSPSTTFANVKQNHSKSTRRTVTPTTNHTKKRNSSLTSSTITTTKQPLHEPRTPRKSKSTSTRQVVTQDELKKMHVLLEQSRQEKQRLSDEMNGKEAVWERLVTAKESYALKVEDMQKQVTRLQDALQLSQQQVEQLESQLSQHTSGLMQNSPHGNDDVIGDGHGGIHNSNIMEQQYLQRIEKLDRLVREWQQDAQNSHQQVQQQQRTYTAQIEQLRRDLAERDQATAIMERAYEAAKQTNSDTIRQYEATMMLWTTERDDAIVSKDNHISQLEHMVNELKACHFLLPPSPNNEEDDEDEDGLFDVGYSANTAGIIDMNDYTNTTTKETAASSTSKTYGVNSGDNNNSMYSSRRRLEQQLELTTVALEDVQQKHKAVTLENEQLREQLSHMHAASGAADQQFRQLQMELSVETKDKRMVMEERDIALQHQLRAEDNYKDLVLTNTRLEQQLEQRQNTQEKLWAVENQLVQLQRQHSLLLQQMHDTLKGQQQHQGEQHNKGDIRCVEYPSLQQVGKENHMNQHQQQLNNYDGDNMGENNTNISRLQHVVADMAVEMKKKTLRIAELEKDLYQAEQRSIQPFYSLDQQQQQQRQRFYHHSATTMCSGIIMPISPISDSPSSVVTQPSLTSSRTHSRSGHYNSTSFSDVSLMTDVNKDKPIHGTSTIYCVNCDVFDAHITMDCPTQNETY